MENRKLVVPVDWTGDNYCCGISDESIGGTIAVTDKSLEGLKKGFEESLRLHVEGCKADGDPIPDWLAEERYEIFYELDTTALLHDAENYTTLSAISRASGINVRQLSHYANGVQKARKPQRERILNGLRQIGRRMLALY